MTMNRTTRILELAKVSKNATGSKTKKNKQNNIEDPYEFKGSNVSSTTEKRSCINPSRSSECNTVNLEAGTFTLEMHENTLLDEVNNTTRELSSKEKVEFYLQNLHSLQSNEDSTNCIDDSKNGEVYEISPEVPVSRKIEFSSQQLKNAKRTNFNISKAEQSHANSAQKCTNFSTYDEEDSLDDELPSESVTSGSEYLPSDEQQRSDTNAPSESVTSESEYLPFDNNPSHSENISHSDFELSSHSEVQNQASIHQLPEQNIGITIPTTHNIQKDLCPLCFDEITHFSRHLLRKHSDEEVVKKIMTMPERSTERRNAIILLRRKGNFTLHKEKNIIKPVRKPVGFNKNKKLDNITYSVCVNCFGFIKSTYLWRHRKHCKANNEHLAKRFAHRSEAQTFLVSTGLLGNFLNKSRLSDVFKIMRADDIGLAAKCDPLICLYGESLLGKHKRKQMYVVVSQKMRIMGKLLLTLKKSTTITNFLDTLKPEMYSYILAAVKVIAGYDSNNLSFKTPSLPLHLGTHLKHVCQIAKKAITIKDPLIGYIENTEKMRTDISQLYEMIESHWCNDVASLANKVLNEKKIEKPKLLPTAEDVSKFNNYASKLADEAYNKISNNVDIENNYNTLTKCTLALLLLFNRRRIGEIQFLDIATYERPPEMIDQEEMLSCLTELEKCLCKMFKRVVVFGKGSKPVPILFSKKTKKYTDLLIHIRRTTDIVPKENKYIFATSGSTRWIQGTNVIQKLASECGANHPELLRSTRFRKQIATILQLMNFEKDELHQVAKFMGHTEKTHLEFYRMTESTYQTSKVAKILLLLESGKGSQFKGKNLNDITLDDLCDQEVTDDMGSHTSETPEVADCDPSPSTSSIPQRNNQEIPIALSGKIDLNKKTKGRVKWERDQKELVLKEFNNHIQKKIPPKKGECLEFIKKHPQFETTDWVRIKTLVFNTYRNV